MNFMPLIKTIFKYILAIAFVLAGANHFFNPQFYIRIMPPYLPWHAFLVYLSGVFEIVLGATLLISRYQRLAAWGLFLLLIAVFPANINMAIHPEIYSDFTPAMLWLRLPLQFVLMAWAFWLTKTSK